MALGKTVEALPFFQQSLRLNPRFKPFIKYTYLGIANLHLGQYGKAVTSLNKAIADFPNDPTVNFALASALAMRGRVDEARIVFAKYVKLARGQRNTVEKLRARYSWMGPGFERVLEGLRRAGMLEK